MGEIDERDHHTRGRTHDGYGSFALDHVGGLADTGFGVAPGVGHHGADRSAAGAAGGVDLADTELDGVSNDLAELAEFACERNEHADGDLADVGGFGGLGGLLVRRLSHVVGRLSHVSGGLVVGGCFVRRLGIAGVCGFARRVGCRLFVGVVVTAGRGDERESEQGCDEPQPDGLGCFHG